MRRALPLAWRARRQSNPLELALQGALPLRLGLLFEREALLLLIEPRRVVALPRDAGPAIELENPPRDVVEEVAIGDRDHRARVVEEVFEPGHRLGVEMVRRLVEQQQVGSAQEQAGRAPPGAVRRPRACGHVGITRRAPQRIHRHLDLRVDLPRADLIDPVLHTALLREHLVHLVS